VSSSAKKEQREYKKMKDRKFRMNNSTKTKVVSNDIHERLELIDKDMDLKLQTLANIFSGTKDYPEEFHQLYVQPLLESGLNLEDSLEMLVEGVIRPNLFALNPAAQFHTGLNSAQAKPRFEKSKVGLLLSGPPLLCRRFQLNLRSE
jgi:hypothetical protein